VWASCLLVGRGVVCCSSVRGGIVRGEENYVECFVLIGGLVAYR
jgi:hypothetical protein